MKAPLWTYETLAAALDMPAMGNWQCFGVSIDTRTLEAGDLFVALPGTQSDGHNYVAAAFASGAAAALVSRKVEGVTGPQIIVPDTHAALTALGQAARKRTNARIIAVTGSVGKTSTKEALRLALGRGQLTHASAASYNNDIGVPLSLARMPADTEYGVFELGMNHAGELTVLSQLVRPHVAVITAVEHAHAAFFSTIEDIADAKAEIFHGLEPGGTAVINRDNVHFDRLAAAAQSAGAARIVGYGFDEAADVKVLRHALHEDCSCVTARVMDSIATYKVGAPGRHWVLNSLGVLTVVKVLGADLGLAALALADMMPVKGRGQRHRVMLEGRFPMWVVDESYNANPASMRAALDTLGNITPAGQKGARGRRIAILGDMRELGDAGPRMHASLAQSVTDNEIDQVIAVGELMGHLADALPSSTVMARVATADEAARLICAQVSANDVVMVKGSFSMSMAKVVNALLALNGQRKMAAG
jgi:UDP-N-acetylmuramoyl-tripeptide--D-alanyl-D-alanine ligase